MVEWLLGDENNKPYREKQLVAKASGNFFKVLVKNDFAMYQEFLQIFVFQWTTLLLR